MNMLRWVARLQGFDLTAVEDMVQPFYSGSIGIRDSTEAIMASSGATMVQAMNYLQNPGYDVGPQTFRGFARRLPKDWNVVANAIALWGCVGAGIGVPPNLVMDGSPWSADAVPTAEDHFVPFLTATDETISFATWGLIQAMDRSEFAENCDELWVVYFPQLVKADGTYLGRPAADLMAAFNAT
jgi:hypothetical protein